MKGFIIAGGKGTRMRPLSSRRPKHLIPVANRPIVEYQIECLARAGVTDVILCTNCVPDGAEKVIDAVGALGVRLNYSVEETPLDTAGALAYAGAGDCSEPFFALNGDALFDLDLTAVYTTHVQSDASVTIAALWLDHTGPYGVLDISGDGSIAGFREPSQHAKLAAPSSHTTGAGHINMGVYVMDPAVFVGAPTDRKHSLERETFPALAARGALYACEVKGFWLDVGRPLDVATASWAVLDGKVNYGSIGEQVRPGIWVMRGAVIDSRADVRPPVHIGEDAIIAGGARVGPYACIGARSEVFADAVVERSILFEECVVCKGAVVEGVVADHGVLFEERVRVTGPQVFGKNERARVGGGN